MDALSLTQRPYCIEPISKIPPTKVFFVVFNPAPHAHFEELGQALSQTHDVSFIAAGEALQRFAFEKIRLAASRLKVEDFNPRKLNLDDHTVQAELAIQVAKICSVATTVILEVEHHFFLTLQDAIVQSKKERNQNTPCVLTYYDNPQGWVPGGYSQIASAIMKRSQAVLFANFDLASENLYEAKKVVLDLKIPRIGIGYYPLQRAQSLSHNRLKKKELREKFFGLIELNQEEKTKVLVYLGENNPEYFEKSLPKFLDLIEKASIGGHMKNILIIFQPHPYSKGRDLELLKRKGFDTNGSWGGVSREGNWIEELETLKHPQLKTSLCMMSYINSDEILPLADVVCGRQSSLIYQIALANIPYMQVGHAIYRDVLIKNGLCKSVTTPSDFIETLNQLLYHPTTKKPEIAEQKVLKGLGLSNRWRRNLRDGLRDIEEVSWLNIII